MKLNLILLQICDESELEKQKAKSEIIADIIDDRELKAQMYLAFANAHRYFLHQEQAEFYYQQCLELTKDIEGSMLHIHAELNYAILLFKKGEYLEAYKKLILIIENPLVKDDSFSLMTSYSWLSEIEKKFKNHSKSLEYYVLMSQIAKEIANMPAYVVAQIGIGINYYYLKKLDLSLDVFKNAIEIAEKYSYNDLIAEVYHHKAVLYQGLSQLEKTEERFLQALKLKEKRGSLFSQSVTIASLGTLYLEMINYQKAKEYLLNALSIRKKYKLQQFFVDVCLDYAKYFILTKNYKVAIAIIQKAIAKSNEDDNNNLAKAYGMLESINAEKANYDLALKYAKLKFECNDNLEKQESQQEIEELKMSFELESTKNEIQKNIELEKYKTALKDAARTKDEMNIPVQTIKKSWRSLKKVFQQQNSYEDFDSNMSKILHAIEKIEEDLNIFENNKNITFKLYLDKDEMVEFKPNK